jgi:hypothetical protein
MLGMFYEGQIKFSTSNFHCKINKCDMYNEFSFSLSILPRQKRDYIDGYHYIQRVGFSSERQPNQLAESGCYGAKLRSHQS